MIDLTNAKREREKDDSFNINSTTSQTNSFKTQKQSSQIITHDYIINSNEENRLSMPIPSVGSNKQGQKNTTSSSEISSNDLFKNITCRNIKHNQLYLSFDKQKMCLVCLKCREEGKHGYQLDIIQRDSIIINAHDNDSHTKTTCLKQNCPGHPSFFCENCRGAICYKCMLNQHLAHSTNSIQYISNSFKDCLTDMSHELKNQIEESNIILSTNKANISNSPLSSQLIDKLSGLIESANEKIASTLNDVRELYYREFCEAYQSNDKIASDIDSNISKLNTQYANSEHVITNLIASFDDYSIENVTKCEEKQKSSDQLKTIRLLIKEAEDVLNRLYQLNESNLKNKDMISSLQENSLKRIFELEESLLFSIKRGCIGNAITLDRFSLFKPRTMVYFKTSSIRIIPSSDLHLLGVNVCGLYINESKMMNPNYQMNQLENRESIEISITLSSKKDDKESDNDNKDNDGEYEVITKEEMRLYGIVNANDPVISLYFPSQLLLKKGESYILTINNLNGSNYYGDFWTGGVTSLSQNSPVPLSQIIKCNTTGMTITFSSMKKNSGHNDDDIQSDFDEFTIGLIGGIIYSMP